MYHWSKSITLALLVIIALAAASLACGTLSPGGGEVKEQPTQPPAPKATSPSGQQPTSPPKATATTAAASGGWKFANPNELNSYRARITMGAKKKDGSSSQDMQITMEYVKDPRSTHVMMGQDMEVITIKDTTWVKVMGKWMQQPASQQTSSQTPDSLLPQEDVSIKELGVETVNGIRCKHYSLSGKVAITVPAVSGQPERKISAKVQGEAWIADQAGLPQVPVRQRMEMEGSLGSMITGTPTPGEVTTMEMELYNINTPITINPPEGATILPGGPTPLAQVTVTPEPTAAAQPTSAAQATPPGAPQAQPTTVVTDKKVVSLFIRGTDVIYLAGRADVKIPPLGTEEDTFPIIRCGGELIETFPASIAVKPGTPVTFRVTGAIDFWGGQSSTNPDGQDLSDITAVGGVSGYYGPQGALVGVFLGNANPKDEPEPETLDFESLGTDFATLAPEVGQVFFIGDGLTGTGDGEAQTFIAPGGATRLFVGFADASGFYGEPGCYGDNGGEFQAQVNLP
jgi:hypothetical protein